jgi:hypothetical protein
MNTKAHETPHLPPLAARMAAFLAVGVAIAALTITAHGFDGVAAPAAGLGTDAVAAGAASAAGSLRCPECGVIESVQEIGAFDEAIAANAPGRNSAGSPGGFEADLLRSYEITIRLRDGSMRVIRDPNPANWRHGEPVTIIAGAD